jgi:metalloendopeptidase OMA1, mitochondrial
MNDSTYSSGRRKIVLYPILIALIVMGYQYCSSDRYVNPETGRAARVALSEGQEAALGLQSYREVLSQSRVISSGPEVDMVRRVAERLAAATGDAGKKFEWRVSVVQDPQANAFCLPGGKMVVYTGIIPIAQSDEGLATVLGHEMAHATSRHGSQRLLQTNLANTFLTGAAASVSLSDMDYRNKQTVMAAVGAGAQYGVLLPFSREHETEADLVGLHYMARAGYDPRESIAFWQRMAEASSRRQQPPEFASTHPSHGTRIERLKQEMPRAIEEYNRADRAKLNVPVEREGN